MKIGLEVAQGLVKSAEADAGVGGRGVIGSHGAQAAERVAGAVVFLHHHANRIHDGSEHGRRHGFSGERALFHVDHVREQDLFFFHQVDAEFAGEFGKDFLHLQKFGMTLTVNADDFGGERFDARALFADEDVMGGSNVADEVGEGLIVPVLSGVGTSGGASATEMPAWLQASSSVRFPPQQ
jgi:hypothetical protein